MNELLEDLKIANDNLYCTNKMLEKELKKSKSIIKEAREYIENHNKVIRENKMLGEYASFMIIPKELLEILDKGSDKEC